MESTTYKKIIVLIKDEYKSIHSKVFENAYYNIKGDYYLVSKENTDDNTTTTHVFNLDKIESYKVFG